MPIPVKLLTAGEFYLGGRYGDLIRRVIAIVGNNVAYSDPYGVHVCSVKTIATWASTHVASPTEEQRMAIAPAEDFPMPATQYPEHVPTLYAVFGIEAAREIQQASRIPAGTRVYDSPLGAAQSISKLAAAGQERVLVELTRAALVDTFGEGVIIPVDSSEIDALRQETRVVNGTTFHNFFDGLGSLFSITADTPTSLAHFHKSDADFDGVTVDADALASIRSFLEPLWADWQTEHVYPEDIGPLGRISSGLCRMSSAFLMRYLDLPLSSLAMGEEDGGFYAPGSHSASRNKTDWRNHTWVQVGSTIIDLTADQFGADIPTVVVTSADDDRYRNNIDERTRWFVWGDMQQMPVIDHWMLLAKDAGLPAPEDVLINPSLTLQF